MGSPAIASATLGTGPRADASTTPCFSTNATHFGSAALLGFLAFSGDAFLGAAFFGAAFFFGAAVVFGAAARCFAAGFFFAGALTDFLGVCFFTAG